MPAGLKPKSLRGILAFQAARGQKGALIHAPQSNTANESNVLIGVSNRGLLSGRGRVRVRGIGRQRSHGRTHSSNISRAELMSQHRSIVDDIMEAEFIEGSADEHPQSKPNLPVLTEGIFWI